MIESRKSFLHLLKNGTIGLATAGFLAKLGLDFYRKPSPVIVKDRLTKIKPNILLFDFGLKDQVDSFIQDSDLPDDELVKQSLLGSDYKSSGEIIKSLLEEKGFFAIPLLADRDKLISNILESNPKLGLAEGYYSKFSEHGKIIADGINLILGLMGHKSISYLHPIQKDILTNLELRQDELGNHGIFATIDEERIIQSIQKSKFNSAEIINLSIPIGRAGFYYVKKVLAYDRQGTQIIPLSQDGKIPDGFEIGKNCYEVEIAKPDFSIVDSYYGKENAVKNLSKLFKICRKFPNKFFVAAAGNELDDIKTALAELDEKPENLLLVGQWGDMDKKGIRQNRPFKFVYGADIYVNNKLFGLSDGSSLSVAVISAIISILRDNGLSFETIKKQLLSDFSDQEFYYRVNPLLVGKEVFTPFELARILKPEIILDKNFSLKIH